MPGPGRGSRCSASGRIAVQTQSEHTAAAGRPARVGYDGTHAKSISVYISTLGDLAVVQSPIVWREPLTTEQMTGLLAWAFAKNLVKVGQVDGAVVVLADLDVRTLDAMLLERVADAVANGADDVFGQLSRAPAASAAVVAPPASSAPPVAAVPPAPAADAVDYATLNGPPELRDAATLDLVRGGASLVFDQAEWKLQPAAADVSEHYEHVSGDAYFRVIAERVQVPFERLEQVVLENARGLDPNMRIVRRGWRDVNGVRVMVLEMEGAASGARCEDDSDRRHEAALMANRYAILHEHIRLQPFMAGATPAGWRRWITARDLRFRLGSSTMKVRSDLTPVGGETFPPTLRGLDLPELVDFLQGASGRDRTPHDLAGSHAKDWSRLDDRMNFIVDPFRSRHLSREVWAPPFTEAQTASIRTGRVPEGPL